VSQPSQLSEPAVWPPKETCGVIICGSDDVFINNRPAACAHVDATICSKHSGTPSIATGSATVIFNNMTASLHPSFTETGRRPARDHPPGHAVCHASPNKSSIPDDYENHLSVSYPPENGFPVGETHSIALTCTNGVLPESLRIGDICVPQSGIPATVSCGNITPVPPGVPPPLGPDLLWRLTTHLYLNHAPLGYVDHLSTLPKLYLFEENASGASLTANLKRVAGIEDVAVTPDEAMVEGVPVRVRTPPLPGGIRADKLLHQDDP